MVIRRKRVGCSLQVGNEIQHLRVLFMTEGREELEIDGLIGAASAVMWTLYQSTYVPTLTLWSPALGSGRKTEVADTCDGNERPLQGGLSQP